MQFKNIPGELESERVQGRKKDLNIKMDKVADRETDRGTDGKTDRETNREIKETDRKEYKNRKNVQKMSNL